MDVAAEIGTNPVVSKYHTMIDSAWVQEMMTRLTREGTTTAEPVSRDQILRRERGQGNVSFPCSADHERRIGNLTRLIQIIHTLLLLCDDHTTYTSSLID